MVDHKDESSTTLWRIVLTALAFGSSLRFMAKIACFWIGVGGVATLALYIGAHAAIRKVVS